MRNEFRAEQLPIWEDLLIKLVGEGGTIPEKKEWANIDEIIEVLNAIGKSKALNHTFLPSGGGLDITYCKESHELGCIELGLDGFGHVLSPEKLTFHYIKNAEADWGYFYLSTNEIPESGVYESIYKNSEELVEISPGNYVERERWDYDYDNLAQGSRLITRNTKGDFVTFGKASVYNQVSGTYDARHNKKGREEFANYIRENVQRFKENK